MSRETNVEFVTRLMEFSPTGALSQAFIIEAIGRYADECVKHADEVVASVDKQGFISGKAWLRTAEFIAAESKAKYGRNSRG